jgi:uncharacterized protein
VAIRRRNRRGRHSAVQSDSPIRQQRGAAKDTCNSRSRVRRGIHAPIGTAEGPRRRIRDYALARADNPTRTRYSSPITVVFGVMLGVLVSLCSVGAGALGVAVLFFLYPRLPPVRIVGSDLAHAVPLTLVAGLGHWLIGSVDWYIVGALLLGSLPGISIGSHVATRISDRVLLPVLASMLVLIGLRLIAP